MLGFFKRLFGGQPAPPPLAAPGTLGVEALCRRLGMTESELRAVPISYRRFELAKRTGGFRTILAPDPPLKALQRRILHRLLRRLRAHSCATGFERRHSIVTNALPHVRQSVIIKLDLKDFFGSTSARRVESYFRRIGWNADAAALLTTFCTHDGALPPGAPTSPRLANLVNTRLDARLFALARRRGAAYSRYADDLTFSGSTTAAGVPPLSPKTLQTLSDNPHRLNDLIRAVKRIVEDEGYHLHTDKKLRIARRHDRQLVTGLVVNDTVNLTRATRRRLRAVEHHLRTNRPATLTPAQLAGWHALQSMIRAQSTPQRS